MIGIPYNIPYFALKQEEFLIQVARSRHLAGDGYFTDLATKFLRNIYHKSEILLTPSCTAALEITALLLNIKPGDEIILPSFTFVSTANAFALRGATLVFCEINPMTLVISTVDIEKLINDKTKAIVVVQYAGSCGDILELQKLCKAYGICLIEDAAQSIGSYLNNEPIGSFGDLSTISFHETKNIHCGEGGALIINNPEYYERAEIIREKGTNRSKFYRGEIDKYTWQDIGSSFLLSELQAAFLYAQLQDLEIVSTKRKAQWLEYQETLFPLKQLQYVAIPEKPHAQLQNNGHIFWIILENIEVRSKFINFMKLNKISVLFHYVSLHNSPYGKKYGMHNLPISEKTSNCLVRIPNYYGVNVRHVCQTVLKFFN